MALPPHNRYTFSGVIYAGSAVAEEWSFRLCTGPEAFADQAARTARAAAAKTAYQTHLAPIFGASIGLKRVRVSQHGEGGRVTLTQDGAYNQADWVGDVNGTGASNIAMPLQTAVCVSLQSERGGPTGKGRIFLPWPGYSLGADYRLSDANRDTIATSAKGFINAINGIVIAAGGQDDVQVVSSKGYMSRVTAVRVGRVPDTQRSRRGRLAEEYETLAL